MKVQVRHLMILAATIVALMLASCGPSEDDATSFDDSIADDEICEEIAETMCYNMFQCCTGKTRENVLGEEITLTEGECVDDMILQCEAVAAQAIQAAENETMTVEMEAAKACVEAIVLPEDSHCVAIEQTDAITDLCVTDLLFSGLVETDGDCFWHWECSGSAYCGNEFTCRKLPGEGDTCLAVSVAPSECAEGLACNFSSGICEKLAISGDDCLSSGDCAEDLYCDNVDTDASLTCTPTLLAGQDCTDNVMCQSGQCAIGFCSVDTLQFGGCQEDAECAPVCEGTLFQCDPTLDNCAETCTGDMFTSCLTDADCTTAGGTCEKPICREQTCVDGGICYEEPSTIDYCSEGIGAPCTVFGPLAPGCGFF